MLEQKQNIANTYIPEIFIQNSFKPSLRNEMLTELQDENINKDRKYILKMLLNAIDGLYWLGIYIYPNIIELFQMNGFKSSSLLYDTIYNIKDKIKKELKGDVEWINHRALKKGNKKDKNIIFCFLLYNYREIFLKYLQDYLKDQQNEEEKIRNLMLNLQRIIDDVPKNNIFLSVNLVNPKFEKGYHLQEQKNENKTINLKPSIVNNKHRFKKEQISNNQINESKIIDIKHANNVNNQTFEKVPDPNNPNDEIILLDHIFFDGQNHFNGCNKHDELLDLEEDFLYNNN